MEPIDYRSDFDFVLDLRDCKKHLIMWPTWDNWRIIFYSGVTSNSYCIGVTAGEAYGCYEDNGRIHVVMAHHGLGAGTIRGVYMFDEPNEHYPDGVKHHVYSFVTDMELKAGGCCGGETLTAVAMLPVTTVELFGGTVDEINAQLIAILKGESVKEDNPAETEVPVAKAVAVAEGSRVLQPGVMPARARQGVIYSNLGRIRLGSTTGAGTSRFDAPIDMEIVDFFRCFTKGAIELKDLEPEYDADTRTVTVTAGIPVVVYAILKDSRESYRYLMKGEDGIIRAKDNGFKPIYQERRPPLVGRIHLTYGCGFAFVAGLIAEHNGCRIRNFDFEIKAKCRRGMRDWDGENWRGCYHPEGVKAKSKWKKVRDMNPVNTLTKMGMGIARVRFARKRRKKRSAWVVFSFISNGDVTAIAQL